MTEHRTLSEDDAVLEIRDTLAQLDAKTRDDVLATLHLEIIWPHGKTIAELKAEGFVYAIDRTVGLPLATFGDMDRPVGPEQLDEGTGPL